MTHTHHPEEALESDGDGDGPARPADGHGLRGRTAAGHTGGFGEPTCSACHFDAPVDDEEGQMASRGLPRAYEPGVSYPLRVVLSRFRVARGGFQLAARNDCEGIQAGALASVDDRTLVTSAGAIAYIHHTREGTTPTAADSVVWAFDWTAPREGRSSVVFNIAANAADGDASQFGDHIYTHSHRLEAR